jgi:replicative DNA helicase
MAEFLDELRQHEKRTKTSDRPFLGLDTGFPVLNQVCGGMDPLGSGQLCIVTGSPGSGKTTFCLQMAWQALESNEVAVLYVSYNEPKFVLRLKTLCQLSKIPANSLLKGNVQADRLAAAVEKMSKWGKGFFVVEGTKDTTVEILRDYCERVRGITGERRVLAVVDPLEAIPVVSDEASRSLKLETRASELHFLSRELAIPIVLISSSATPSPGDPQHESPGRGKMECWEDMLLLLETDHEATTQRFPEREGYCVRVHVLKNRSGGVGTVAFDFLPECHHFVERGRNASPAEKAVADIPTELAEFPSPFQRETSEASSSRPSRKRQRNSASTTPAEVS